MISMGGYRFFSYLGQQWVMFIIFRKKICAKKVSVSLSLISYTPGTLVPWYPDVLVSRQMGSLEKSMGRSAGLSSRFLIYPPGEWYSNQKENCTMILKIVIGLGIGATVGFGISYLSRGIGSS
jgi:hypothetical protein